MKFIILKGWHYSLPNLDKLWPFGKKTIHKRVKFKASDWYPRELVKHSGWNKLYGISGFSIHGRSARFVWQPDFDNRGYMIIAAYVYGYDYNTTKHKWYAKEMIKVRVEEWFEIKIEYDEDAWVFAAKDNPYNWVHITMPSKMPLFTFKAFPYFGGKDRAYNKIEIEIENV